MFRQYLAQINFGYFELKIHRDIMFVLSVYSSRVFLTFTTESNVLSNNACIV